MKVKPLLAAGLLLICMGASAASIDIKDPRFRPIMKFYEDCTFVAENCPQPRIRTVLLMIQRGEEPKFGLLDVKERRIYAAINATRGMVLQPDPLIHGPFPPIMAYVYRILSAKVRWASDSTATIEVTRESVGTPYQQVKPGDASRQARPVTDVDEWVKVGDTWKVRMIRYVPVES